MDWPCSVIQQKWKRRVGGNRPCASSVVARPPSRHACRAVSFRFVCVRTYGRLAVEIR